MRVAVRNIHQGGRTHPGTGRSGYSILEPIRIPPHDSFGMGEVGDFVAGAYSLPQNPVSLGEFVRGAYTVPQNPIRDASGMSGCGCGGCGMGAVDLSFQGTGIVNSLGVTTAIPNYVIYVGVGALILLPMMMGGGRRRRR